MAEFEKAFVKITLVSLVQRRRGDAGRWLNRVPTGCKAVRPRWLLEQCARFQVPRGVQPPACAARLPRLPRDTPRPG